jgi:hypothetical protein
MKKLSPALLLVAAALASVPTELPSGIERLANGNTLITDAGLTGQPTARIIEVDSNGYLVWAYVRSDIPWAHTARRLPGGNTLISATNDNRVVEVDPSGDAVWQMTAGLSYPNEAFRLPSGNTLITDRDNDRVIEVDTGGSVVWSYTNLLGPHNGSRLANGNTLICDSDRSKVVEVNPAGVVVWQYATGLSWGRCAQRLSSGNTLIADSRHNRVIEVDSAGTIHWTYSAGLSMPYMAARLATGNTIISSGSQVIEVDPAGTMVWQYPPPSSAVVVETLWVTNPASGCSLYVHIHRPSDAGPAHPLPAVVLIPRESYAGTVMDQNGLADAVASDGFAVLHLDADGRGNSRNGTENYNGYVHQDGLRACAALLASQPYVDPTNLGIYTRGYGIVMATGMAARYADPPVKFLADFEGPSNRYEACSDSGGHVPVPPDSEAFWLEREAGRFLKLVPGAYLRVQTATDHTGRTPGNRHAIALIDSATSTAHGGSGISVWTRVNDSVMNPENQVYSPGNPPAWIREEEERHIVCRELLYLHELAERDFTGVLSPPSSIPHPSSLSVFPNPCRAGSALRVSALFPQPSFLSVFAPSGRLVRTGRVSDLQSSVSTASLAPGVYIVRLTSGENAACAKLIVR